MCVKQVHKSQLGSNLDPFHTFLAPALFLPRLGKVFGRGLFAEFFGSAFAEADGMCAAVGSTPTRWAGAARHQMAQISH